MGIYLCNLTLNVKDIPKTINMRCFILLALIAAASASYLNRRVSTTYVTPSVSKSSSSSSSSTYQPCGGYGGYGGYGYGYSQPCYGCGRRSYGGCGGYGYGYSQPCYGGSYGGCGGYVESYDSDSSHVDVITPEPVVEEYYYDDCGYDYEEPTTTISSLSYEESEPETGYGYDDCGYTYGYGY